MSNDYYNGVAGPASAGTTVRSAPFDVMDATLAAAFDKLPSSAGLQTNSVGFAVATGAGGVYAATVAPWPATLLEGQGVRIRVNHANPGGGETFALNGFAAKPIRDNNGAVLISGMMLADSIVTLTYVAGRWQLDQVAAVTIPADGSVSTAKLANGAATNAKLADMAQATIKGRAVGAGTGDPQDLSADQVRAVLGIDPGDSQTFSSITVTGDASFSEGINGGYATDGPTWGSDIWSIGQTWSSGDSGVGFVVGAGKYGIAWIRASNAGAIAEVGEGLYGHTAGALDWGIGAAGLYANAAKLDVPLSVASGGTGGGTQAAARSGVGLGTTDSPVFAGVTGGDGSSTGAVGQLIASGNTFAGVSIRNASTSGSGYLDFHDGANAGRLIYDHGANKFSFVANGGAPTAWVTNSGVGVGIDKLIDPALSEFGCSFSMDGMATFSRANDVPLRVKRGGNDGTMVSFYSGAVNIATISNAGSVVTYGSFAGHHWSQIAGDDRPRDAILPGTVCEAVDELCEWPDTQGEEYLPKFGVSDTFGSAAVYGVFKALDEDGDAEIVALGAYFIRVRVPVALGDLLESAGDGTACPQVDDWQMGHRRLMRASTIAKVTGTTPIRTYGDGSWCVPCTLHCG